MNIIVRALQEAQAGQSESPRQPATDATGVAAPAEVTAGIEPVAAAQTPAGSTSGAESSICPEDFSLTSANSTTVVRIDVERLREAGRLPSAQLATQTADDIRRIKWPLLNAIAGSKSDTPVRNNVVLVTSALAGEGKTFTSLNLALSIVRDREMRVVLVDADVARPGLTPTLGLEDRPGLVDVLDDVDMDVSAVTFQTDVDGLFFVPAGKWHPHAPEFLASSRMPQIIGALSRRVGHGVIILDSPPLLATNEAQVVTRYAGQVLLVVQADSTDQQAVLDALALVDKATPVSAVLNRVESSMLSRYYGHYQYGYGKGPGDARGAHPGQGGA